ncbi:flagellar motor switch protein FliN [Desulfurobacterium thermolithotrophum DSM 11699]|uniref:Flagellar motor switch protein FliN n=1 Tax=Desulfurobacterium thermolithotrophum (strain DSM 11699 / BSA) TaxID=868864 RepID=F0S0P9_DESTD|nr:flagellar motor switch protein FliN [Desulfurobacterium thermolithotrophum]ADY73852.1 flagellar motor switch protein FliN [Desulfurobacterium thermolithotrophum DSM 11699]
MKAWENALKEQESLEGEEEQVEEKEVSDYERKEEEEEKLELLKDIPLEVSIEIGSTSLPLEEILKLHTNSIVELDRYIHEPVDIKINGKLVAKGKLYTIRENYGIKITQIITPEERMKLLED